MHVRSRLWLTILSLFLTLWLISGFLPLSAVNQIILTLVSVVAAGLVLWYQWRCLSSRRDIRRMPAMTVCRLSIFRGMCCLLPETQMRGSNPVRHTGKQHRDGIFVWIRRSR